jgi:hypothetical protein
VKDLIVYAVILSVLACCFYGIGYVFGRQDQSISHICPPPVYRCKHTNTTGVVWMTPGYYRVMKLESAEVGEAVINTKSTVIYVP